MSSRMPVVFVSHGAPDVLLRAPDTLASWHEIAQRMPEPKGILVISAHWAAAVPTVSLATAPQTLHDFSGFPAELSRLRYPAPGAPGLAERVLSLLSGAGIKAQQHPERGLDHGAWIPLSAMFPNAQVPVTQLSLTGQGPAAHFALGRALAALRDEGILLLASGAITHNFGWLNRYADGTTEPMPQARTFADWVARQLAATDLPALLDYRSAAYGAAAHPDEDHFLPLFVALGAADGEPPQRYRPSFMYGGLAMDAYAWGRRSATALLQPAQ